MNPFDDETPKYRKKSSRKPPKKADHKHQYTKCVLGIEGLVYVNGEGLQPIPIKTIGSYCPECGKVGTITCRKMLIDTSTWHPDKDYQQRWNEEARKEFDDSTRTLPYFWLGNAWENKFVNLKDEQ